MNNTLKLTIPALMLSLLTACASTSTLSYEPEESGDYKFDPDSSFAMNVVEGSLGFHNGLRDADAPKDADTSPTAINYAGNAYLGLMANGIGGALLGLLGTNSGEYPLDYGYGIYYVPVSDFSKASLDSAYAKVESDIIHAIEVGHSVKFSHKVNKPSGDVSLIFSGDKCTALKSDPRFNGYFTEAYLKAHQITRIDQCELGGYKSFDLMRFSHTTPNKQNGNYAVIGIRHLGQYTSLRAMAQMNDNFYFFNPKNIINPAPFVLHNNLAWFFIDPVKGTSATDAARYSVDVKSMAAKYPNMFHN
ncbi:hypothetical protein KDN34_17045 [Shewanella yunxiaonensis]|uniref:Lipoprotein n=1 Tax=Shewanella yunxiaonensis TaxID=2829809 RepID=A0ABX7YSX1_9GAMM|nr:hypothetical protein [Shewanella yunxiaonensis]QUN05852.1 hypothetical protein KDN34_17045 [Shewanella yunxiaonensis]